ncbi:MAG: hypothetical protein K6G68_12585 [Oscillospiraceae bacterium]|nr:hypothetical protein [Oscillospiraceae bacterium]
MDGTGFLKTVSFGGFDKKDVLAYVDKLNTQIYTLENELNEAKKLAEVSGDDSETKAKYEELLKSDRAKIAELQASNDSAKNQIKVAEDEVKERDKEIEELKAKLHSMEDELVDAKNKAAAASTAENNAMDLSNVFMEAQRSASSIVTNAKENARKMDEDAKKLANQVVDDANSKASTIVKNADEKALRIVTEAENRSAELSASSENMKAVVLADVQEISASINKLKAMLDEFTITGLKTVTESSAMLAETESTLKKNGVPKFNAPRNAAPAARPAARPAPAPAAAPAPVQAAPAPAPAAAPAADAAPAPAQAAPAPAPAAAPTPAPAATVPTPAPAASIDPSASQQIGPRTAQRQQPKPTPKLNNFGFDMSEIEALAKNIEASAAKTKANSAYDGNVDAKNIKVSKM